MLVKVLKLVPLFFLFSILPLLIKDVHGATIGNEQYYEKASEVPPSLQAGDSRCTDQCGIQRICWNSQSPGETDCPDPSLRQPCSSNESAYFGVTATWTKFQFSAGTECRYDSVNSTEFNAICVPVYLKADNTYSTGDKYDTSNPPVLKFGTCQGNVGNPYKTCCSVSTAKVVNARGFAVDPYEPLEGDCNGAFNPGEVVGDNTVVSCGGGTGIECGQPACDTIRKATPTPTPAPGCPAELYAPPENQPAFLNRACTPVGNTCSVNCAKTCIIGTQSCATSCITVWGCQGTRWYNDGRWYYTCPATCTVPVCTSGQTRCTTQVCSL